MCSIVESKRTTRTYCRQLNLENAVFYIRVKENLSGFNYKGVRVYISTLAVFAIFLSPILSHRSLFLSLSLSFSLSLSAPSLSLSTSPSPSLSLYLSLSLSLSCPPSLSLSISISPSLYLSLSLSLSLSCHLESRMGI